MLKYMGFLFLMSFLPLLKLEGLLSMVMYMGFLMFFMKELYFEKVFFHMMGSSLGGDIMSVGLVVLSLWVGILMINSSIKNFILEKGVLFLVLLNSMIFLLFLLFFELNVMGFYVCFESILIPIFLIIMGWGYQPERLQAGVYLMFYTLFASLPLLLVILLLDVKVGDLGMLSLYFTSSNVDMYLYLMGIVAFLVKLPAFMLHLWLPKAHVEAPIAGSMVLAGILLKMGGYGLIRFSFYFMSAMKLLSNFLLALSLMGMVYLSLVCLRQSDMKALIAYSSVVHMGMVVGGIFTMTYFGVVGAYVLMVGHGLCSSGMFCLAVINYNRVNSRSLFINKGLITLIPSFSLLWFLLASSNMAAPPSINLLGEIFLLGSIMNWSVLSILGLGAGSFLSASYCLYVYSISQHGDLSGGVLEISEVKVSEYFLVILHWLPLNILFLKSELFMM